MKFHSKNVFFAISKQQIQNISLGGKKKPSPYKRRGDFIVEHCIIFLIFFCLVMFHELQT
jgi:hypothetical protein